MIKYIITYLIIQMVVITPPTTYTDKFGFEERVGVTYAVTTYKRVVTKKQKVFFNKDSAKTFYEEVINFNKSQPMYGSLASINSNRIDSVKFNIVK